MVKPEWFYARFDEECRAIEKCHRTKIENELSVVNWGKQQGLFTQIPLGILEIRMYLSSGHEEGTSHMLQGKFLPAHAISQIPSA